MFVQGILFFSLTLCIEVRLWSAIRHRISRWWSNRFRAAIYGFTESREDDPDVAVERKRILESASLEDVLVRHFCSFQKFYCFIVKMSVFQ
jgi:hypothetical protein